MKLSPLLMITILLACSKKDFGTTQLLINPGMESGDFNNPDSWNAKSTGGSSYNEWWTKDAFYSGHRSLEITCSIADSKNEAYWYQVYNSSTLAGKTLVLTAKVKGVNVSRNGAYLVIAGFSDNTRVHNIWSQPITGDFDWTTFSLTLPHVDKSVKYFYIYFVMTASTTGTIYFDDASLMVE